LSGAPGLLHGFPQARSHKGQAKQGCKDAPVKDASRQWNQPDDGQDPTDYALDHYKTDDDQDQPGHRADPPPGRARNEPKERFHFFLSFFVFCLLDSQY
jgi:hypothetical protein